MTNRVKFLMVLMTIVEISGIIVTSIIMLPIIIPMAIRTLITYVKERKNKDKIL
jgi:hypothetical protein